MSTFTTGDQAYPSIAADSAGDFVVAWMSYGQDGSLFGIFAQRYSQIVPVQLVGFRVE